MKLLGYHVGKIKAAVPAMGIENTPALVESESGGWWPVIREGFAGAWQNNVTIRRDTLLAFTAVYACVTRIAQDLGKMPLCIKEYLPTGIWKDIDRNSPYESVLIKPNDFQTRSQFIQQWIISKLLTGNTYVIKERDARNIVRKLYVLDPSRVRPLITPDGSIYYELARDPLSELLDSMVIVPASEIIHDRMPALFHPLIGTSPIFACGLAASQGHHIQKNSASFFKNMGMPSGILTAPGSIGNDVAARLKEEWKTGFSGKNVGAVAVLGDGLKFEAMTIKASDAQVIEQLKWSGETVCSAFSMPPFMVGIAPLPANTNIEAVQQQYWSICLQSHMEGIESSLTEGLGLDTAGMQYEAKVIMDLEVLLRMDTAGRFAAWKTAISGSFLAPNEARRKENYAPVKGGDTVYMQQQNFSLEALNARDTAAPAPAGGGTVVPGASSTPSDDEDDSVSPPEPKSKDDKGFTLDPTDEDEIGFAHHELHVELNKLTAVQA